ncbi:MaoC/PaaZ C-terminal domain-containing protein [Solwaraspora sp. WMMD1047]|uniref:MaoC/PaaZ C-terminal domain-containing protein n=1 Tax=Solwaraspora sp. WMMD1047 TaxID=3016102 RepID=UPI00241789CA|nr:MaoC/PaaZ C-terminal domain-containing protein [Solwaraspora sp. WMMD1047]MDG4834331.1 MaoC/PaaZ C-terminal domain-containing protein [Solwaraspora sp. WMMD1047]
MITVGSTYEAVVVDDLTRTQIVQYAGASGDFNPLHTDEVFATQVAGQPTVMAHGMLTMGLTGRALTDWFGDDRLLEFGARFVGPVWPGDTLTVRAEVDEVEPGRWCTVSLSTSAADGRVVLTGRARARLA